MSDSSVYTDVWAACHANCQNEATCQMFSVDDANLCKRYSNACSSADSSSGTQDIFAKSGFYVAPKEASGRCTHYEEYNENPTVASYCMTMNDYTHVSATDNAQVECEDRGNCHVLVGADLECSDGSLIGTTPLPLTISATYTLKTCVEAVYA
jgi:hypothetical protein